MADRVDRVLERDLKALDFLRQHEVLSDQELRSVINRRRDFEYKLHRRFPIVSDFQRAIQYETNLHKMIQLRVSRLKLKNPDQFLSSIRRREFGIYQRMVGKFPGQSDLWSAFLDYAREIGARKALSSLIAKALQLHPLRPELWVKAAAFEHDINNSIEMARVLMQQALRMLPKCPMIWLAFFKMELQYARRLLERARISASKIQVKMDIPTLLYRRATEAIKDDWMFRVRCLQMLPEQDCEEIKNFIVSDLKAKFCDNSDCMEALARFEAKDAEDNSELCSPESAQWCIDTAPCPESLQVLIN